MDKLAWCFKQKNGIEIVDPNETLYKAYLSEAKETLDDLKPIKAFVWKCEQIAQTSKVAEIRRKVERYEK